MKARDSMDKKIEYILHQVKDELFRAMKNNAPMNSAHEGYAVILEELDETWDEIKRNDPVRTREEMIQVAAMAIRFLYDVERKG
jgi:hypothetical protein